MALLPLGITINVLSHTLGLVIECLGVELNQHAKYCSPIVRYLMSLTYLEVMPILIWCTPVLNVTY